MIKKKRLKIEEHLISEDVYSEDCGDNMLDNDELNPQEAAFMQGYNEPEN